MSLLAHSFSKLQRGMRVKTIFQIVRLLLKLGSCILYIAQTVGNENVIDSDYVYPRWCCHGEPIFFLTYSSQPKINTILHDVIQNYNLCPNVTLHNYTFQSLGTPFPHFTVYSEWEQAGYCYKTNQTSSSCQCSFKCGVYNICANKANQTLNESSEESICQYDYAAFEQPQSFYWKFLFYPKTYEIWLIQSVFGILDMIGSLITTSILYYTGRKWINLFDIYNILDIFLGLAFTVTLTFPPCLKNMFIPSFLQSFSGIAIFTWLVLDIDTFTKHHRFFTYHIQKGICISLNVIAFVFISTCTIEYVERVQVGNRADSQPKDLAESVYMLLITITTVGYGDFSPGTWLGRALTLVVIFTVLLYLPGTVGEMLETFKESGIYSKSVHSLSASKYIVVCLSSPRLHFLLDFLNEVDAQENTRLGTVILSPIVADRMVDTRLSSTRWRKRVIMLTGSALRPLDLDRAGVKKCTACFVISDRHSDEPEASDQETILRAHSIHSYAPKSKLYIYLLKVENKPLVSFAQNVVCEGELKHAIYAANCVCPGFSTFISLLLHTTSAAPRGENAVYNYCSGNEIYDIKLRDSVLLKDMIGVKFINAALFIHKKYGILLIAIQKHDTNDMILNPGKKITLEPEDRLFYLSQTNEEDEQGMRDMRRENENIQLLADKEMVLVNRKTSEDFREPEETSGSLSTMMTSNDSPIQSTSTLIPLDISDDIPMVKPNRGVPRRQMSLTGSQLKRKYTQSTRFDTTTTTAKAGKNVMIGAFTFSGPKTHESREVHRVPKLRQSSTIPMRNLKPKVLEYQYSQDESSLVNNPIHKKQPLVKGVPKPSLFMLPVRNRYHTIKPCYLCCLQIGWKTSCHEMALGISVARRLSDGLGQELDLYHHTYRSPVIVIADEAGPQLYNFILPLRAAYIPRKDINPIILMLPACPNIRFLESISCFPQINFMTGNPNNVDDLLIAGIIDAKLVILCLGDGTPIEKQEQHMTDATKIQTFLKLKHLFPRTRFLVEIFHRSNMEILCSNRSKSTDLNGFVTTPHFMSGEVFSPSLLDTILYQSAEKDYIIDLVKLMVGLDQGAGNRSLSAISRKVPELINLRTYGDIMEQIAKEWDMLAVAIYHSEFRGWKGEQEMNDYRNNIMPFIINQLEHLKHPVKKLPQATTEEYCYKVLVNPCPNINVHERDVILVLKSAILSESIDSGQGSKVNLASSHSMDTVQESTSEFTEQIQVDSSYTDLDI